MQLNSLFSETLLLPKSFVKKKLTVGKLLEISDSMQSLKFGIFFFLELWTSSAKKHVGVSFV